jgi:putative ABC transport system ATP-binding protein
MPLLEIEDLRKAYRTPAGAVRAVLDVPRFALDERAQVALRGRSGSGKTTLLNVIAGILRPDQGRVVVAGRDVVALSEPARDAHRARTIGYVFQTFNLLQGYTALENVVLGMAFGPGIDREFARELLGDLGLADRADDRPATLSVGQQQRVALARALANRPQLVLADEPTGNLDPELAAESLELLRRLCREHGAALLLVSHDRDVLASFETSLDLAEINVAAAGERA